MFSKLRLTINIDNLKADKMINQLKQCFTEIYDSLQCVAFIYQQLGLTDFLEIKKLCDLVRFQFTELFDQVNSPCEKQESLCALNE